MVVIRLTDDFVADDPVASKAPWAYLFVLGNDKNIIPSSSRNSSTSLGAIRNGSPFQINLSPGCDFEIDNTIFQNLVNNATGGGNTELINRILHYVNKDVIEVVTVESGTSTVLTAKQILAYTAP